MSRARYIRFGEWGGMRWFRFFDRWPIICYTDFGCDPPVSMQYSYVVLPRPVSPFAADKYWK